MSLGVVGVLVLLGLVLAWRGSRRTAAIALGLALGVLWVVGCRPVPQRLLDGLQDGLPARVEGAWAPRNAIILLGAGTTRAPDGTVEPSFYAYGRIARAAAVYRQCHVTGNDCKLLISGGDAVHSGRAEAPVYGDLLAAMGVPRGDMILESRSLSTWQNARFSRPLLDAYHPQKVVLVTSGMHMRRALLYFAHFGIHPEPVRADLLTARQGWLPKTWNALVFDLALHEYLGQLQFRYYNLTGKNPPPLPPLSLAPAPTAAATVAPARSSSATVQE
ncbi:MAG: YdcF family protein [Xanthomonadaceae bacterium]|nr:YdcF family protein [Xanthomonadaceae bacterium]MDE1963620.1 YdcF family protein [Xanthomonadaceae bacterium]